MMRPRALALVAGAAVACGTAAPEAPPDRLRVADVLGIADPGFERALAPRPFEFPVDHGPHPGFAAEWWYFTGNLQAPDDHRFGYQLTFFRTSLRPPPASVAPRASAWETGEVWMAHFAVTDVDDGRFYGFERFERGALGLAGATPTPWRVWLNDWSLEQVGSRTFPVRLRAAQGSEAGGDGGSVVAIDLRLEPLKPVVLQGDRGLSQKGPSPGNASYYYSFTRLATAGTVRIGDAEHRVEGLSWLDREWSTSALEGGLIGWDWFALQLDDGSELMFYQLRQRDGSAAPQSAGTLVAADGATFNLAADDVELRVTGSWQSPLDGTIYPAGWAVSVPARRISLRIAPLLAAQELDVAFRYWEGAVTAAGTGSDGRPVSGAGYVELTGYADGGQRP